ncbi:hypothetical protein A4F85_04640 [Delftia sp. GW456-R20]|uniref:hypothetical protein n=1 Tax=Delftia sp. GW456-R20 TaxID=1827145 RepID=UPI0007B47C08|nr:hypothetical protein [Delftia sp. GW456-R20]KZK32009.1 hypothetical protein A4F85_04640 [Delftia sp. GW456-R20]
MTNLPAVAVTYTGTDNPFLDRIYSSGLTFTPGQTRLVPVTLAQRFLRHSDVFKEGEPEAPSAAEPTQPAQPAQEQGAQAQPDADTAAMLAAQAKELDVQREQADARFALLESLESMDRSAVISWADQHYKQKIPANLSAAKARDMAKGFIDQYGMPA